MKWYFACNDRSEKFFTLIKSAVDSALKNTTLKPVFLYDGEENELTKWLRERNVQIIPHRVSFYDQLKNHYDDNNLIVASGTFLRCDIPIIEKEDDFVLYTDCDVIFLKDFKTDLKPEYFACSSQNKKNDFKNFNAGVMLMNVKKLREDYENFCEFIKNNLKSFYVFDQTAYQIFYSDKVTKLPIIFNYKPYWGINNDAVILHFHGAKPYSFTTEESLKYFPNSYLWLYKKNPKGYDYYLEIFKKYYPDIEYCYEGIEKLKSGLYPLSKHGKSSFFSRIKTEFKKECQILMQKFK